MPSVLDTTVRGSIVAAAAAAPAAAAAAVDVAAAGGSTARWMVTAVEVTARSSGIPAIEVWARSGVIEFQVDSNGSKAPGRKG
ncbi:uncharacterized protein PG986_008397 [Apiospora aurea]|uniref:Secreted protein n=1 Tax=Apiospora aurea TaxID=335848 RepID=A0ABR1QFA2_9PEZI